MRQRLQDGRWTFPPPLGYRAGRDATGAKTIIPDEHSAPLITQAFEEFATGLHTREQVLRKITQFGLRTKKGRLLEGQFENFMRQLQPNAGYMRLYREIVLDVLAQKAGR